jgi:large subunit ribosomal protein L9
MKMKLLLKEDVPALGITGDVVEVAKGYARNYLLPRELALEINESTKQAIEKAKKERAVREAQRKAELENVAHKISGLAVTVRVRVSPAGTMYAAVAPQQIAEALQQKDINIDPGMVRSEEPIKSLGDHHITIHLHPEIDAELTVTVEADENAPLPEGVDIDEEEEYEDELYGEEEDDEEPNAKSPSEEEEKPQPAADEAEA